MFCTHTFYKGGGEGKGVKPTPLRYDLENRTLYKLSIWQARQMLKLTR